ncbi:MAG TPA: alpha/beta hydrolase [Chryseolinea sp.]|nr:alpha/beta hydrolase [Chryseolinea sp.]
MKKDKTPLPLKIIRWVYPKVEAIAPALAHRYFVKLFFTPFRFAVPDKEKKAETFAKKFDIEINGKRIQCYSWGEGRPVLFVHGWGGRAMQFRRFIKPFNAAGFMVVAFDGPAHGKSDGKSTTLIEFEQTLIRIYERIGEPAAIVAHSFGGAASLFSASNGLTIPKLVNIASPTIGEEIIDTYLKAINGSSSTAKFFKDYILKTQGRPFDEFTASYFIKHLPRPLDLLLIHDENDKEVSVKQADHLINLYPAARLIKTKGLGHTRILKDDQVISECVTFVRGETSIA